MRTVNTPQKNGGLPVPPQNPAGAFGNSTWNWRRIQRPLSLVVLLLVALVGTTPPAGAQSGRVEWSSPTNISNSRPYSALPAIVTDEFGAVHVFWSEDMDGEPFDQIDLASTTPYGNTIFYSRWDGGAWSTPVDILYAPNDLIAEYLSVTLDAESRLHVVWTGQTNIYYSYAPSWKAGSAQAWSSPVAVATDSARSAWESNVLVADDGTIHIFYAARGTGAGVNHLRSRDEGISWESMAVLSQPFDALETSFSHVRALQDAAGRMHVTWQTNQSEGYGQAVYYRRSMDRGTSWEPVVQLGYRGPDDVFVSWPYMTIRGESELNLIYTNGSNVGRAFRVSTNGGGTWGAPRDIITEMEGINGYVIPLLDGDDHMHLVIDMRTRTDQVVGIYYAYQTADGWSPVENAVVGHPSSKSAHWPAAAVLLGNELHVVWDDINTGEIWHTRGLLTGVEADPMAPAPVSLAATPTPEATATSEELAPQGDTSPITLPIETPAANQNSLPLAQDPILIGAAASLVLVLGVSIWKWLRSR